MQPMIVPIDLLEESARKVELNKKLYEVQAVFVLDSQLKSTEDLKTFLESFKIYINFIPFADALRIKMFSHIGGTKNKADETQQIHATVNMNFLKKEIQGIKFENDAHDSAEVQTKVTEVVHTALPQLSENFESFFPGLTNAWKTRDLSDFRIEVLVPYQALLPFAMIIEAEIKDDVFILDDLYCTRAGCPCTDVTCIMLKFDEKSQKEVAYAGFKYDIKSKEIKPMKEFPAKFNHREAFKKFKEQYYFPLEETLESRFNFMRSNFMDFQKNRK